MLSLTTDSNRSQDIKNLAPAFSWTIVGVYWETLEYHFLDISNSLKSFWTKMVTSGTNNCLYIKPIFSSLIAHKYLARCSKNSQESLSNVIWASSHGCTYARDLIIMPTWARTSNWEIHGNLQRDFQPTNWFMRLFSRMGRTQLRQTWFAKTKTSASHQCGVWISSEHRQASQLGGMRVPLIA